MLICLNSIHRLVFLFCLAFSGAFGLTGCRHQSPKVVVASPPESPRGEASFITLPDPSSKRELPKNQSYQRPWAKGPLSLPAYPPAALNSKFGAAAVAVRIVIGVDGKVTEIADSPLMSSTPGPFAAEFRAATEQAIRSWLFEPAEIQTLEDGKDLDGDGKPDYQVVVATQKIPVYYDLRFDFTVVGGEGQVSAAAATPSSNQPSGGPRKKRKK